MLHTCTIYWLNSEGLVRHPRYCKLVEDFGAHLEAVNHYRKPGLHKVLSRMLLLYALAPETRNPLGLIPQLRYSALGAPSLDDGPYFSISHSGSQVAMAVSRTLKTGLDIQQIARVRHMEAKLFLHPGEQRLLRSLPPCEHQWTLTSIWTKKEALGKLLEVGISLGFRRVNTTGGRQISHKNEKYTFSEIGYTKGFCGHLAYRCGASVKLQKQQLSITALMSQLENKILPEPRELLPHRDLMLIVDTVESYKPGESLVAGKYIDKDCPFLRGHFPGNPMVPGVILVEMMFQAGGLFVRMENREGWALSSPRAGKAIKIGNAVFKAPVVPDTGLKIRVSIKQKLRMFYTFEAAVFSDHSVYAEAEITICV